MQAEPRIPGHDDVPGIPCRGGGNCVASAHTHQGNEPAFFGEAYAGNFLIQVSMLHQTVLIHVPDNVVEENFSI